MAEIVLRTGQISGGYALAANTITQTLPKAAKPGDLLVAAVRLNIATGGAQTALTGCVPGFSLATSIDQGAGVSGCGILYKVAAGGEQSIVATVAGANGIGLHAYEFATPLLPAPLDKTASATSSGQAVTTRTAGITPATTENVELLFACCQINGGHTGTTITPAGWVLGYDDTTNFASGYRSVAVTGTYGPTFTWVTARGACACVATFKAGTAERVWQSGAWKSPVNEQVRVGGAWH